MEGGADIIVPVIVGNARLTAREGDLDALRSRIGSQLVHVGMEGIVVSHDKLCKTKALGSVNDLNGALLAVGQHGVHMQVDGILFIHIIVLRDVIFS